MHQRVGAAADALKRKGLNVVYIAHANVDRLELPDTDPYSRYTVKITKDCQSSYVDKPDAVAFIRLQTFLRGEDGERKKAVSSGVRELIMFATAANVSKNRWGVTEPIILEQGVNPFAGLANGLN